MLIFEHSREERTNRAQMPRGEVALDDLPEGQRRGSGLGLPQASEMDVVRHYTRLSQQNFSIDTQFYPLGSCTMKYNPRGANEAAMLPGFLNRHPETPARFSQGIFSVLYDLQEMLADICGMHAVSLAPAAGAQGEYAGVAMIRAYHEAHGNHDRDEIIVPDSAHGTNPATASMGGFKTVEIATKPDGDIDLESLEEALSERTAGLMITNPSTLGLFERGIKEIADKVHDAGGLLYYDGANLNAILGKVRPGEMGFDVMHFNLHKTFSTPHGGGGPGAGPVGVSERLLPFVPVPLVAEGEDGSYFLEYEQQRPQTIGRMTAFPANIGVLLRAYAYIRMVGREGMERIAEHAVLNSNYLMEKLRPHYKVAYPERRAMHEFILTLEDLAKSEAHVAAMDVAKRMLDYGVHAPTAYFPLSVPECFLVEPTESEAKETLDHFADVLAKVRQEAESEPETVKNAPYTLPVKRLDDVRAAKELDLAWNGERKAAG
ncbi:glycine dehydrogenase [Thiohalorhabdus denitrificans]|uniref:Probable glycine dehydrogenase (decarboxylating) subunit 2 n=1 Tax=Thiohalorhabdus denitrificans TaxID=381306 RepID=A0A0P9CS62_9GAMM|nr:aminomethyl-transferring glycine dehydrogenase subunit GcvPB [Thiohalorhabdus denitrificans]KPV39518.1 glycine dehydrogenase [Thiohalorhabdus denitrificans]SCX99989.1 glycine dehydrogenase (decarboxylating) beta subunit [Thiohalorhabdus denitrificans]